MNCWDVLGIEPTRNPSEIERAYQQQARFVEAAGVQELDQAYRVAMAQAGCEVPQTPLEEGPSSGRERRVADEPAERELTGGEHQLVREVVIQVQALLNDEGRCRDVGIWKAVLADPPADQLPIRQSIADKLEAQLRPMARQGGLTTEVAEFLGNWFGWADVAEAELQASSQSAAPDASSARSEGLERAEEGDRPPMTNFWPAAIGWIVGLIILTSLFSNMTGS
ncbi:MAG: J domain-containing protein [Marinobacter sp.]|uniref:J domain-containing protein n=1 Tax=Marinobacter sp. TaxID=50741 RepID=UPI00299E9478|nr:J domain-containing protein [Marinobacter sp.]MDX1755544.1 J domain-containing protein [Marinobacter sp.]